MFQPFRKGRTLPNDDTNTLVRFQSDSSLRYSRGRTVSGWRNYLCDMGNVITAVDSKRVNLDLGRPSALVDDDQVSTHQYPNTKVGGLNEALVYGSDTWRVHHG
jgi:hypothetical protein